MERDRPSGHISISQQHTPLNLLEKFGMSNYNPASTPADSNAGLSAFMVPSSEGEKVDMNKIPYSSAVGALLYLGNATRPDLSYAVGKTAKYCHLPNQLIGKQSNEFSCILKELLITDFG